MQCIVFVFVLVLASFVNCSKLKIKGKIVGGKRVDIKNVPWQVYFDVDDNTCGGTLIAPKVVVTAAHCLYGKDAEVLSVRVGSSDSSLGKRNEVMSYVQHPNYDDETNDFDIAILHLENPVPWTNTTQWIKLANKCPIANEPALISGWGYIKEGAPKVERYLRSACVKILNRKDCVASYSNYTRPVSDSAFCAAAPNTDACQGDSGGPLVTFRNGQYVLTGIVSWGEGCAQPGYPGVYTNICKFIDFITNELSCQK